MHKNPDVLGATSEHTSVVNEKIQTNNTTVSVVVNKDTKVMPGKLNPIADKTTVVTAKAATTTVTTKPNSGVVTYVRPVSPITDVVARENQGIILLKQGAMDEIFTKSGQVAVANEFQVHYWSLNFRHLAEDGSILDICIPTTYFNYPQECTSAHIDFELLDVIAMSEGVEELHNIKVNELIEQGLKEKLEAILGVSLEMNSENFNSIHRHPGSSRSQSFSGTDYGKSVNDLGIVFPLREAKDNKANFAGIMAIDSNVCNIAHYEYRVANGSLDDKMEYKNGRCAAMVDGGEPDTLSAVESLFRKPVCKDYSKLDMCTEHDLFDAVFDLFKSLDFKPDTDLIFAENVTKKVYTYAQSSYSYQSPYKASPQSKKEEEEKSESTKKVNNEASREAAEAIQAKCKGFRPLEINSLGTYQLTYLQGLEASLVKILYYPNMTNYVCNLTNKAAIISEISRMQEDIIGELDEANSIIASLDEAAKLKDNSIASLHLVTSDSDLLSTYSRKSEEHIMNTMSEQDILAYADILDKILYGMDSEYCVPSVYSNFIYVVQDVLEMQDEVDELIKDDNLEEDTDIIEAMNEISSHSISTIGSEDENTLTDIYSYDSKREDLISWGADRITVNAASEEQIDTWITMMN